MARPPLNILLAGFGGQGVLFAGKLIAEAGLIEGRELSWLPSYGPEMRGGTANCSVCLSDEPIGSPLVTEPDVLIAMNQPSVDKFEVGVVPGGMVIVDSTMVQRVPEREDVRVYAVPATRLAEEAGLKGLANVILVGKLLKEIDFCCPDALDKAIAKSVPPKRQQLLEPNRKALALGMES
jgi:2-oxoglutarate ferredoxin oxidoreductase subunit gamma